MRSSTGRSPKSGGEARKGRPLAKVLLVMGMLLVFCLGLGVGAVAGVVGYFGSDLPDLVSAADYKPKQMSRVYSSDGVIIGEWGIERRTVAPFEALPQVLLDAVIAAEDSNYYSHTGLDYIGMIRAAIAGLRQRRITQGASTITQQVVKTFLLSPERTFSRKIPELILARRLEQNLTKDEILYLYLNQIYLGHGCYGVEEAARFFFNKSVQDITLLEAALLAGLPQAPERLSPIRNQEAAVRRRAYVLRQMAANGFIGEDEAEELYEAPLVIHGRREPGLRLAPHFVEHVRRTLARELGSDQIYEGGLRVHTTMDSTMQAAANEAVELGLDAIDQRKRFAGPLRQLKSEQAQQRHLSDLTERLGRIRLQPGVIVEGMVQGVDRDARGYWVALGGERRGFLPARRMHRYVRVDDTQDENASDQSGAQPMWRPGASAAHVEAALSMFAPGDVIRVGVAEERGPGGALGLLPEFGPQGILVAMDPHTREVRAMVGGDPRLPGAFNRVTQARRQPGSAFKPVIYSAALESKRFTPASVLLDSPEVYLLHDGTRWTPQNYDQVFRGPLRLRQALASSVNMVAIRVLADIGIPVAIDYARRIGIDSHLDPYLPIALGSAVMSPLDLTSTYAVWASGGLKGEPVFVNRVLLPSDAVVYREEPALERAIPEDLAYLTTDMLTSVVEAGTATRIRRELRRPAAGKTGTTNDLTDTWFVGYVPSLVAAVWVGFDDNRTLGAGEQGSRTAVPLWLHFMQQALEGAPEEEFEAPERGLETRRIDPETGLLAPPGLEDVVRERFLTGTAPRTFAPMPGESDEDSFLLDQAGAMDLGLDSLFLPDPGQVPSAPVEEGHEGDGAVEAQD